MPMMGTSGKRPFKRFVAARKWYPHKGQVRGAVCLTLKTLAATASLPKHEESEFSEPPLRLENTVTAGAILKQIRPEFQAWRQARASSRSTCGNQEQTTHHMKPQDRSAKATNPTKIAAYKYTHAGSCFKSSFMCTSRIAATSLFETSYFPYKST